VKKKTNTRALDEFLRTDPRDVGCEKAMEMLHVYAELFRMNSEAARRQYPGVAAHLRACGPCAEDLTGLLAAIAEDLPRVPGSGRPRG
jgi:hypothetical protein